MCYNCNVLHPKLTLTTTNNRYISQCFVVTAAAKGTYVQEHIYGLKKLDFKTQEIYNSQILSGTLLCLGATARAFGL